jgi:hypothetical protein
MPRISNVTWGGLRYGYLFDIQNHEELREWFDKVRTPVSRELFAEAIKHAEGRAHANIIVQLAELRGVSPVDALSKLNFDMMSGMANAIVDCGRIFISGIGGYFSFSEELEITETHEVQDWWLPEEKLRILQWPDGTHFYAKIGNTDVIVDGVQKWDTKKEAEAAGKKFLGR